MTDEERQKLCTELRTADELAFYWRKLAADEIEWLVKELREAIQGRIHAEGTQMSIIRRRFRHYPRTIASPN